MVKSDISVLVVGDQCEDMFVYGQITRISPEAPVPILQPIKKTKNGGMSANVYNNLISLKVEATLIANKEKIIKTRYVDDRSNQMVLRVDTNDECNQIDETIRMNICNNYYNQKHYDAIIISDYCKGFLNSSDIELICKSNKNVFVDTKKQLGKWIRYATFIKINSFEYKKNYDYFNINGLTNKLIITLGRKGCLYNGKVYSVKEVSVKDVSGAGDTFLAGLVKGYLDYNDIEKAISFAQKCTTLAVQKHGVSTVELNEVIGTK